MLSSKVLALVGLVMLTGCTSLVMGSYEPPSLHSATLVEVCPLGVPGTHLQFAEVKEGIHVFVSTSLSNVDEVRLRARDQVRAKGSERHLGRGHFGEHRGGKNRGLRLRTLGPIKTSIEDTPSGARLTIVPIDPSRRVALNAAIVQRVTEIEAGGCVD